MTTPKRRGLEERFFEFAKTIPGCERIDDLKLTRPQDRAEKADLFFEQRKIVTEVKNLAKDTSHKIEPILDPYRESEHFPMFYGQWPLEDVLGPLPEGPALKRQIFEAVTSAIPELVRKANRQIRTTKQTFHKPKAKGLLVILNDLIGVMTPEIIAHGVHSTLIKRNPDKSLQFSEIAYVWIISETHFLQITPSLVGIPGLMMNHPFINDPQVEAFVTSLQPKWAAFHGVPLVEIHADGTPPNLPYVELGGITQRSEQITRSELWRREYRAAPYLRPMTKEQLLSFGAKLLNEVGKHFLVGNTSTDDERMKGVRRWGDFLEEVNARRVDMRELKPYIDREGPLV
jgi:hypothetical protein